MAKLPFDTDGPVHGKVSSFLGKRPSSRGIECEEKCQKSNSATTPNAANLAPINPALADFSVVILNLKNWGLSLLIFKSLIFTFRRACKIPFEREEINLKLFMGFYGMAGRGGRFLIEG